MNCIDYAINRITSGSNIDDYLLRLAFESPNANFTNNWYAAVNQTTVAQGIRERVIYRTVFPDIQCNGGKTEYVDLNGSRFTDLGNGMVEVNIPDIVTGGRKIISVQEVYLGSMGSTIGLLGVGMDEGGGCGQGVLTEATQGLLNSLTPNKDMPVTFTNVHMTGNNCFVIMGMNSGVTSMTAKCVLEYDQGLSSISPRHYSYFADLVELAVKAYIYRTCRRPTNEAIIRSGVTLDGIRDDIAEYRDAWDQYKEFLRHTWIKCMAYSDRLRVEESIRMMVPTRT